MYYNLIRKTRPDNLPSVPDQGKDATPSPDFSEEEDTWPCSDSFQHRYVEEPQAESSGWLHSCCCPSDYQLVHLDPTLPLASVSRTVLDSALIRPRVSARL